jgi:hypothetical protein
MGCIRLLEGRIRLRKGCIWQTVGRYAGGGAHTPGAGAHTPSGGTHTPGGGAHTPVKGAHTPA